MPVRLLAACALVLAPFAAFAADDENPYKNAKVGDYAAYKMTTKAAGLAFDGTIRQTVTEKTDKEVTVKVTGSFDFMGQKKDIPEQTQKVDLTKPFDPTKAGGQLPGGADVKAEKLKEGKEKVTVGGKEYDATWTTYKATTKVMGQEIQSDFKVWMAKDVPSGMVKMTMTGKFAGQDMEMTMELSETGNKK
jgi:hypothetical protein